MARTCGYKLPLFLDFWTTNQCYFTVKICINILNSFLKKKNHFHLVVFAIFIFLFLIFINFLFQFKFVILDYYLVKINNKKCWQLNGKKIYILFNLMFILF